jgi:hypothetical protein
LHAPASLRRRGNFRARHHEPRALSTARQRRTTSARNLSWQGSGEAPRELAKVIAADGFAPDLILPIARGGLFLAGSPGYALAVKDLHVVNVEF